MNRYVPGSIPGVDPQTARLIQKLYEQDNQLKDEIDNLRKSIPDAGVQRERPVPGILTIPGNSSDGFLRVNPEGLIKSYTNPVQIGSVTPLLIEQGDSDVQVNVVTPLYSVVIPGNSMQPNEQIAFDFGGFVIGTPLVASTVTVICGGTTLISVGYNLSITSFYFRGFIGRQTTPNWDSPTIAELGLNIFALADLAPAITIARGEVNFDWTVDNTLEFSGSVNGVAPAAVVIEGISVIKYSMN